MNLVLIDDEPVILSGLARMIPQIDPGWQVCGRFSDAEEALNNCDWDSVDVALADISMPGMDGLALVRALRDNGFETLVVFITAHASFAYAQQGAHLNMLDYLLKPVSRADLERVLRRAEQVWQKTRAGYENAEYIRQNLHTLRKHFLGDLLFEERLLTPAECARRQRDYGLEGLRYSMALIRTQLPRQTVKAALAAQRRESTWLLYGQELCFELLLLAGEERDLVALRDALTPLDCQWTLSAGPFAMEELGNAFQQLLLSAQGGCTLPQTEPDTPPETRELSASVRLAQQYIRQNYATRLSLRGIADAVYLHPTYLSNVFKKQTGSTVVDYINQVRIDRAKALLPDPRNRIYWIVEQVGFSNQRYFCHVFKTFTGLSPMQYRQQALLRKTP